MGKSGKKKAATAAAPGSDNASLGELVSAASGTIFAHLPPLDLFYLAQTNEDFAAKVGAAKSDKKLWRQLAEREFASFHELNEGTKKGSDEALAELKAENALDTWKDTYYHIASRDYLKKQVWFSDKYDRPAVEAELGDKPSGTFLVRPSSQSQTDYVISAKADDRILHHLVVSMGEFAGLMLLGESYNTLASLLLGQKAVKLKTPLPNAKSTTALIEEVTDSLTKKLKKKGAKITVANLADAAKWGLVELGCKLAKKVAKQDDFSWDAVAKADAESKLTPLHWAVRPLSNEDTTELVTALIEAGANVDAADAKGETPLIRTITQASPKAAIVKALLDADADTEVEVDGKKAVHTATARNHIEILNLLFDNGVSKECANGEGKTPLHFAAQYGRPQIITSLLSDGISIESADSNGRTPLFSAVIADSDWIGLHMFGRPFRSMYNFQVCDFLMNKGANPNATDNEGMTALHHAALGGHRSVSKVLLSKCDPTIADAKGRTPIDMIAVGKASESVQQAKQRMEYLIFIGMNCQMDQFNLTVDGHFDDIKNAIEAKLNATSDAAKASSNGDASAAAAASTGGSKKKKGGKGKKGKAAAAAPAEDPESDNEEEAAAPKKKKGGKGKKGKAAAATAAGGAAPAVRTKKKSRKNVKVAVEE